MAFTRMHYQAVAGEIHNLINDCKAWRTADEQSVRVTAERLANLFRRDNSRFDREKFMTACGLKENDGTQV
jgi:hypothetical protein